MNMKTMTKAFAIAAIASTMMCGCDDKPTLHIYNWAEYVDPDYILKFEKDNNCKVEVDVFDSNETAFAKLMGGATGYDIMFPSSYFINPFKNTGLIEKIDMSKLPNVSKNFDKRFDEHDGNALVWHVPYAFSLVGILYRKDIYSKNGIQPPKKWEDMFIKQNAGRICIMNDIREVIGIALKSIGESANTTNKAALAKAVDIARSWKKKASKMDSESYRTGLPAGEFYVAMSYLSDALQLVVEHPETIGYVIPEEGVISSLDVFVVLKSSKNKELAYKFIDGLYDPETAAKNDEAICAPCSVVGAERYLSDEYKKVPGAVVTDEMFKHCEPILDIGDGLEAFSEAWDKVKAN